MLVSFRSCSVVDRDRNSLGEGMERRSLTFSVGFAPSGNVHAQLNRSLANTCPVEGTRTAEVFRHALLDELLALCLLGWRGGRVGVDVADHGR